MIRKYLKSLVSQIQGPLRDFSNKINKFSKEQLFLDSKLRISQSLNIIVSLFLVSMLGPMRDFVVEMNEGSFYFWERLEFVLE